MIFDAQTRFSNAQAITASAVSTNVIDTLAAGTPFGHSGAVTRDFGVNSEMVEAELQIQVVQDFATLTSLTVSVQTATDSAFTSPTTVLSTQAVPAASLKAGYVFNIDELPFRTRERYIRLNYTVGGSNATAGAITAGVVAAGQRNPLAAQGY